MTATLVHRGPDGEGFAARDGCTLGFRRLAIVDLAAESPPFGNEDGTLWTVCNGEIYNGDELHRQLRARGHRFRTHVDTEVIPHLYEEHGLGLAEHLDGMFAFAIWDERRRTLVLGRDRAGEKPLYYWQGQGGELAFASELRALCVHPRVSRDLDPIALRRYLLHDYFPAPLSPLRSVRKLPAGHLLIATPGRVEVRGYWDLADYFQRDTRKSRTLEKVAEEVDARISLAVQRRKRADVPVGVFLSGGIDSSTVLAHLTEQNGPGVPAFALGHAERSFDEARFARDTAAFFRADYHELILTERDLDQGLGKIADNFDEPLGDASTIPTYLLSMFARQSVKVVLSGEGADELFAGYPTYVGDRLAELYRRLPALMGKSLATMAQTIVPASMGNVGLDYLLSRFFSGASLPRVERHHAWFGSFSPERQQALFSPELFAHLNGDDPFASAKQRLAGRTFPDGLAELLYMDFTMYLQDDLLTKVDRATMLASLEARAPFLDHELAEFVAGLPSRCKLSGKTTKAILRRAVRLRLPPEVLARRKRGFNIPFSRWLLHGLGDRLRQRFTPDRVRARGLFSPDGVTALLNEHLERQADHRKPIFTLLAFDLWCDRTYGEGAAVPIASGSHPVLEAATG